MNKAAGTNKNASGLKLILQRGGTLEFKHKPVLLEECIEGLNIKEDGIYVDGTLGGAGHSRKIVEKLNQKGLLIGIDRDEEALEAAKKKLEEISEKIDKIIEVANKIKMDIQNHEQGFN